MPRRSQCGDWTKKQLLEGASPDLSERLTETEAREMAHKCYGRALVLDAGDDAFRFDGPGAGTSLRKLEAERRFS